MSTDFLIFLFNWLVNYINITYINKCNIDTTDNYDESNDPVCIDTLMNISTTVEILSFFIQIMLN